MRSKPINTARGMPGNRRFRGDYARVIFTFFTRGCGVVGTPAFRAPSGFEGEDGKTLSSGGLPGADQTTRAMTHVRAAPALSRNRSPRNRAIADGRIAPFAIAMGESAESGAPVQCNN